MGAPKQKWTSEEEAALKAGIAKYGQGKWSMILKDQEYGAILHLRSNVDLKDKWRNLNVAATGLGSRHRVKLAMKNTSNGGTSTIHNRQLLPRLQPLAPKAVSHDDMAAGLMVEGNPVVTNATPLTMVEGTSEDSGSDSTKKSMPRLDNLVLVAIAELKEPCGSRRAAIAMYIEDKYIAPPNLESLLADTLKLLTNEGKLIKVKRHYRIAPPISALVTSNISALDGDHQNFPKVDNNGIHVPSRSQVNAELEKMKSMTAKQAAAAAAQAVAEAEAAIAEAEEAAREAEEAEGLAEEAQLIADVAMNAFQCRTLST